MYQILKEVTDWNIDFAPNHTYLLNKSFYIIAYAPDHGKEIRLLKNKKLKLDKRYRKFIKSNHVQLTNLLNTL